MPKTTMRMLCLLELILHALAGAGAQSLQTPSEQKTKPGASPDLAPSKFFDAVKAGDVDLVRRLPEQDPALFSVRTGFGWIPLHLAVDAGQEKIVKLLLAKMRLLNCSWLIKPTLTPRIIATLLVYVGGFCE